MTKYEVIQRILNATPVVHDTKNHDAETKFMYYPHYVFGGDDLATLVITKVTVRDSKIGMPFRMSIEEFDAQMEFLFAEDMPDTEEVRGPNDEELDMYLDILFGGSL
jgi:hypothetical protein